MLRETAIVSQVKRMVLEFKIWANAIDNSYKTRLQIESCKIFCIVMMHTKVDVLSGALLNNKVDGRLASTLVILLPGILYINKMCLQSSVF